MAAAASDKARFYLEQSVPELQGYKEKGIFSSAEISAIASKRSAFEHRINMAGASDATDYARYAGYEINLDLLRRKRCRRLGVKGSSYAGQKRVFSVLERGTRKFSGDLGLWMQYLEFCRHEGSNAKLVKGITSVLRLHPIKGELWVWAAKYFLEDQGDISTARSYMQRGLRFCGSQREVWIQYVRLEMIYLAKIAARRKILRLDDKPEERVTGDLDGDMDEVALPTITEADLNPEAQGKMVVIDDATLEQISTAPAFDGAIVIAISDAAVQKFKNDPLLIEELFECVYDFQDVPCTRKILDHIRAQLSGRSGRYSSAVESLLTARLQLFGLSIDSPDFPPALYAAIKLLRSPGTALPEEATYLQCKIIKLFAPLLRGNVDEDIRQVILICSRKQAAALRNALGMSIPGRAKVLSQLQTDLASKGIDAAGLVELGVGEPETERG